MEVGARPPPPSAACQACPVLPPPLPCSYEREMDEDLSPRAFAVLMEAQARASCAVVVCCAADTVRLATVACHRFAPRLGGACLLPSLPAHAAPALLLFPLQEEEMRRSLSEEMRRSRSLSPDRGHAVLY